MKTIIINEIQKNRLFESQGVPDKAMETAMDIVNSLLDNLDDIEDGILELQADNADDEEYDWEDDFSYDFSVSSWKDYYIDLYASSISREKANTDTNGCVEINYYPIHRIINRVRERYAQIEKVDVEAIENTTKQNIIEYLYPVILHELTHDEDVDGGSLDYRWLGSYNRFNEEDLRDILYLFADNEMNARISSAAALMELSLKDIVASKDDTFQNGQEFYDYVDMWVMEEDELACRNMESLLGVLEREYNDAITYHQERRYINNRKQPYSLSYDLFRNDRRLKNNRKLKVIFNENYKLGVKYVIDFYTKLYERYRKKIRRSCWYAYQKILNKYENN